jgi:hypothetical protein
MQFLKKHYEKIVLSVVLLGLAVAAAALTLQVTKVQDDINSTITGVQRSKPKPWVPVDLSTNQATLRRVEGPFTVSLSDGHNLFNPVKWVRSPNGGIVRQHGTLIGASALVVTNIEPLDLMVSFDGVQTTAGDKMLYPVTRSAPLNVRSEAFTILKVNGKPEAPDSVVVQLKGEDEAITVLKDKPYQRVVGYTADMIYTPTKKVLAKRRVKDTIQLEGSTESYEVVAINPSEVVLSAKSSGKRTTIRPNSVR